MLLLQARLAYGIYIPSRNYIPLISLSTQVAKPFGLSLPRGIFQSRRQKQLQITGSSGFCESQTHPRLEDKGCLAPDRGRRVCVAQLAPSYNLKCCQGTSLLFISIFFLLSWTGLQSWTGLGTSVGFSFPYSPFLHLFSRFLEKDRFAAGKGDQCRCIYARPSAQFTAILTSSFEISHVKGILSLQATSTEFGVLGFLHLSW